MDIEIYDRREKKLKLREELIAAEEDRMHGSKGYSVDEIAVMMRSAIKEMTNRGKSEQISCQWIREGGADACFPRRFFAQVSPEAAERLTVEFEGLTNSLVTF